MPKRTSPTYTPEIILDTNSPVPLYKQLYERLRRVILAGQLECSARLPSTRALACELGISRTTTVLAYEQLLSEGYLESKVGRGTTVACPFPVTLFSEQPQAQEEKENMSKVPSIHLSSRVHSLQKIQASEGTEGNVRGIFSSGVPEVDMFPYEVWARLIARRARHSLSEYAHYQSPAGYAPLREAIAAHIGITRGVRCTPEQIILTAGSQGALDLAARTLLNPGEAAWIENPGYFGARGALLATGAHLVPVPVDEQGLVVEIGRQRSPDARLVSITPSHQFPTGVTMSLNRRLALLDWARQAGAWILEDDYDSEYRFSGRPLEALQGLDPVGRVLYIGTFSKVLFPSLRLGYIVAPLDLIEPLLATRRYIDVHVPILEQMALTDFLNKGYYVRHLRHMHERYRQRRDLLLDELRTHLGGLLEIHAPEAGIHLVGWLPANKDDFHFATLAIQGGIDVTPISKYSLEPLPRKGLLFGYASTKEQDIRLGVKILAEALNQH